MQGTERSSQPGAGPGQLDEAHQEASTPLRSGSVEVEPGEAGPPRPHIELPRPGARKNRSTTARVPRTLSLVPIGNLVKTEPGGAGELEGAPPDTEEGSLEVLEVSTAGLQREGEPRESEGLLGGAALTALTAQELALRERMAQIEAMLAAEKGDNSKKMSEEGEERNEPKEEGEIEEEEGEIRTAKKSMEGEMSPQKENQGEGVPAKPEGEQGPVEGQVKDEARVRKGGPEKERLKKQKKGKNKKKGEKKRGEGIESKGLKQGEGGMDAAAKLDGRGEAVVLEPSEEGEIKSPKRVGDEAAAQKRSKDIPGRVLIIADEEEEGEVRIEGQGLMPVRKDTAETVERPKARKENEAPGVAPKPREEKGAPVALVNGTGLAEGGKKKSGLKLTLGKGALSKKDGERRETDTALVKRERAADTPLIEGVVKREKAANIVSVENALKAEPLPKEPPAKAPGLKLKLKLGGVVVGDKGAPGKGATQTESARPSPGVDSPGKRWKGVKTETGLPAEVRTSALGRTLLLSVGTFVIGSVLPTRKRQS